MVEDLDPPMRVRTTIDERGAASAANPAALDDVSPFEFLGNRCNYGEGLSRRLHAAPSCQRVASCHMPTPRIASLGKQPVSGRLCVGSIRAGRFSPDRLALGTACHLLRSTSDAGRCTLGAWRGSGRRFALR
jgi:hypothetical protein